MHCYERETWLISSSMYVPTLNNLEPLKHFACMFVSTYAINLITCDFYSRHIKPVSMCDITSGHHGMHRRSMPSWCVQMSSNKQQHSMTLSNGKIVTGHLCWEFTCLRWIPHTKASDADLLMFSLICARINDWVNNREAGDLRRHHAHYDVIVMETEMPLRWLP